MNTVKDENTTQQAMAIDSTTIRERILLNATTVADWATARLMCVRNQDGEGIIGELYEDYGNYCRREKRPPLLRKTWIGAMKLSGFQTESGAFIGLALRD